MTRTTRGAGIGTARCSGWPAIDDLRGESSTHYTKLPTHPRTVERMVRCLASTEAHLRDAASDRPAGLAVCPRGDRRPGHGRAWRGARASSGVGRVQSLQHAVAALPGCVRLRRSLAGLLPEAGDALAGGARADRPVPGPRGTVAVGYGSRAAESGEEPLATQSRSRGAGAGTDADHDPAAGRPAPRVGIAQGVLAGTGRAPAPDAGDRRRGSARSSTPTSPSSARGWACRWIARTSRTRRSPATSSGPNFTPAEAARRNV